MGIALETSAAETRVRHALLVARQRDLLLDRYSKSEEAETDRLGPRDLWNTVRIAQVALSPDGEWVAFVKFERPCGGALQQGRIYIKRVGSGVGEDEFPLTGDTLLADTPVWKPRLFDPSTTETGQDYSSQAEILFRARLSEVDVMQLYIVRLELPPRSAEELEKNVRRLTNAPTHPWAPKWRRFIDENGKEQNCIYYVATSPESPPVGYDYLVYDSALVGWWDNLRLPYDRWRFYQIDAYEPCIPQDLLGSEQPLLDFVYGVWNCWDVHPGGQEIVFSAVNRTPDQPTAPEKDEDTDEERPRWPNEITTDIFRMRLPRTDRRTATVSLPSITGLTSNIRPARVNGKQSVGSTQPVKIGRRGQHDDYIPSYSPDGTYIVYAEKQFSALLADYPRISRLILPETDEAEIVEEENLFYVLNTPTGSDSILPIAWKFYGPDELVVLVEESGRHKLQKLDVCKSELSKLDASEDVRGQNQDIEAYDENRSGSIQDFDARLNACNGKRLRLAAITSSITSPPELRFSSFNSDATGFNSRLHRKAEAIGVEVLKVSRRLPEQKNDAEKKDSPYWKILPYGRSYKRFENEPVHEYQKFIWGWLVLPPEFKNKKEKETFPLVQLLHGGPNSSWIDEFHMRFNASLLASQGYVVAMVNFRGSTGTGEEPETAEVRSRPSNSEFLKQLNTATRGKTQEGVAHDSAGGNDREVSKVVKTALNILNSEESEEKRRIQEDLGDDTSGSFQIRHLRKIERYADQELFLAFVGKLTPGQYARLVERDNQSDLRGWGSAVGDVDLATTDLVGRGYIDKHRLAVIGGSYGAYLGARLLGWRDRAEENSYRAYVLHAGVYDPLSHFATDVFWVQYRNFGVRPWVRPRRNEPLFTEDDDGDPDPWRLFSRISPLLRSHRLVEDVRKLDASERPAVLITHGLSDLRVHWQQSVLLHRMLKDRGVKSRLALYPGLGHRLDQPEPSVQWWKAALCWLEENGVPPGGKLPSDTGYQG
jgi:acetyl esterase/lipase